MKIFSSLIIAALCVATLFSSCKNDPKATQGSTVDTTSAQPSTTVPTVDPTVVPNVVNPTATGMPSMPSIDPTAAVPKPTEPPQNAKGIWHYTCSKGCAGGAGSAAPCAKCGTVLAHNTKYHGDVPTPAPGAAAPGAAQTSATPPKPEPAQNAKGVWHYTCADGCAGGAGAISPCAKCSKPLVHNQTYHQ
jgi:hypothetical protein